ncbi:hypothetical protein T265_09805 [Opisthorchis viverrini]|uniref:Uncharacterized protein n=1 Tax=Opisthorchis viverrini TaxID=6198 RepID=A0A074Z8V0_OPIVI|nr:hypothetical protein T265_09805 [Opisthorchis viverrini]KER22012.1 hypothetical protein T265_09805 [Opisthorchis viverrini]
MAQSSRNSIRWSTPGAEKCTQTHASASVFKVDGSTYAHTHTRGEYANATETTQASSTSNSPS